MPALKMKTKPSSNCSREPHSLHTCNKASKISKGSGFQVKTSQKEAVLDTCIQNFQDVSSITGVSERNCETTEANDLQELFASPQFSELPLSVHDLTSDGRTGFLSVAFPSELGTIFSPRFEQGEDQFSLVNHHNAVVEDELFDFPDLIAVDSDDGSCDSFDYQACKIYNDYIPDLSGHDLSFNADIGFADIRIDSWPDCERISSDVIVDMEENHMILPLIEEKMEANNLYYGDSIDKSVVNSDAACLSSAIHQLMSFDQETELSCHGDLDDESCSDPQSFLRNFYITDAVSSLLPIWSAKDRDKRTRKSVTLVLDIDETLVHSTMEPCDDADFSFSLFYDMKGKIVYVRQRPYVKIFLECVAQMFKVAIFTASKINYAEQILDFLDPDKKLFSQRMYRESCKFPDSGCTKDLSILGVDLSKVVIIDNSPQVFRLQVNNGIPIKSWFNDKSDRALISLLPFLEELADADDVRPLIAKRYNNKPPA